MSTGTDRRRLPMSPANLVIWGTYALGVLVALVAGRWPLAAVLAAGLGLGVFSARRARRPAASDTERVARNEYQDERDRAIGRAGFAVVGVVAMVVSIVECMAALVFQAVPLWPAALQLVVLAVAKTAADQVAAQRH